MSYYDSPWAAYVSVAERRRKAAREMEKLRKKGHPVSPVHIEGRTIAKTFWGKSWCDNLEQYSDYSNRLPRGRTYARNGSVVDLQITAGEIQAYVSGSELYKVAVKFAPLAKAQWKSICSDCSGAIDSLIELLQGRLSTGVMERICRQRLGLFPASSEMKFSCSCPDGAYMCKHVAAVLYGIGARLDQAPELLFRLRAVDERELIVSAGKAAPLTKQGPGLGRLLGRDDLADMFGLDMMESVGTVAKVNPGKKAAKPVKGIAKKQTATKTGSTNKKTRVVKLK
ncbi:MAG: SWIM zinc finger family protein [Acidobacteria bacterium]|nr:SWIM zinc finger family protein [Acidobacteriota bacterium]